MNKKLKILLASIIIISILIIYNYNFISKVYYEKNNTPSERQYRKENADRLIKSSNYKEFYVDIYRENEFTLIVDDYSPIRIDYDPTKLIILPNDNITSDDIELIWEDLSDDVVRLTINIYKNGTFTYRLIIDYS
ncbi:hypothetical protein [Gemelliphila palaticanis]|uniref:DUF4860 domain-containing protein n=1 Tax=Gemelliphila palaticanis TaxID=81950 RepID=A0ABX2SXM1_9BACL|nr:hypothetical protein [Gemella palaticanis]MBF0715013.1 hypothetical protein [Gemella palaticanis]NYS46943.1 hypothetical protein [Gemella palaticanis]